LLRISVASPDIRFHLGRKRANALPDHAAILRQQSAQQQKASTPIRSQLSARLVDEEALAAAGYSAPLARGGSMNGGYSLAEIGLHWLVALLVPVQYLTGGSIERTHQAQPEKP
jgi:hypothetical protein